MRPARHMNTSNADENLNDDSCTIQTSASNFSASLYVIILISAEFIVNVTTVFAEWVSL